ncbi:hypothetical protein BN2127_JRS1_09269 [Bacillus cereus]|nr:hypothetical protein BN2127_JRS1_09269 [Bacillus cereus]
MGTQVKIVGEKSGLHILLKLKGVTAFELTKAGLQKGVKVYSPSRFWLNPNPEGDSYIMLGFGGLSIEEIENGVRLLASCIPSRENSK